MNKIFNTLLSIFLIGILSLRLDASENYPQVEIVTTSGTFVIEMDRNRAPKTVENFLKYVESGSFIGTVFHRVIPGFVIQTGGYDVDLNEIKTLP
jgi:peptidyl-prolyl cis-trans isomerase A (cyclophilin A)